MKAPAPAGSAETSFRRGSIIKAALPLVLSILASACVHRIAGSGGLGLPGANSSRQTAPEAGAGSHNAGTQAAPPPQEFRAIPEQQIQGARDPFVDDQRIRTLQARLQANPRDIAARMELARIFEEYRLCDNGLEQYEEVLRLAGAATGAGQLPAEQAALGLGRCAQASGRIREAIPLLEASVKKWPSAGLYDVLGLIYDEAGDLPAGERAFREAVARDAKSGRLRNNLGYNLLLQGKAEAAEGEFRAALELDPKSATSRNNLAAVLVRRGNPQGALEQFQLAADAAAAHNNLAVILLEMGQYEKSREELVKALTIRPYFGPALENLKLVQEHIRRLAGAEGRGPQKSVEPDAQDIVANKTGSMTYPPTSAVPRACNEALKQQIPRIEN